MTTNTILDHNGRPIQSPQSMMADYMNGLSPTGFAEESAVDPVDAIRLDPGKAVAHGYRAPAQMRHREVRAVHQLARAKLLQNRQKRLGLANGRRVEPDVLQSGDAGDTGSRVGAAESTPGVGEDEFSVGVALAVLADVGTILGVAQGAHFHDVQGDEPAAFVRLLPHPLRQEVPNAGFERGRWLAVECLRAGA